MKKVLLISGIAIAGFGLYRYFNYQVTEALKYDYKLKNFRILGTEGDNIKLSAEFDITNNSNFEITLTSYNLKFYFKGVAFGGALLNEPVVIMPNSTFTVKTQGALSMSAIKTSAVTLASDILTRKPINIEIEGYVKVKFLGVNSTLNFNKERFQYSADVLKDFNLSDTVTKFAVKNPKISGILGIK
jgi:LEA14-like dessication related protein